jgi:hypothetical protein
MRLSAGNRKAQVFPEPVLATAMTSRPVTAMDHDCAWMGDGEVYLSVGLSIPGVADIGYMEHTGCHQLNVFRPGPRSHQVRKRMLSEKSANPKVPTRKCRQPDECRTLTLA